MCFSLHSQKDYICFDIVPRHHNIIRYRKGLAMIKDDFHTVCSWTQFPAKNAWKYDLLLGTRSFEGSVVYCFEQNESISLNKRIKIRKDRSPLEVHVLTNVDYVVYA